MHYSRPRSAF